MPLDDTNLDQEIKLLDPRTGLLIVPSRDNAFAEIAQDLAQKFYLRKNETIQQGLARAAFRWCKGDLKLGQRLYDAASRRLFMFASPLFSNAPLPGEDPTGMPISCFLMAVMDALDSIIGHGSENKWLGVKGGGTGTDWSFVRAVSDKAPGPIPFIHAIDGDMEAFKQGTTRKGSYAAYLNVNHPDIIEFLNIRIPTGDQSRKCHSTGFHNAVNITDEFMHAVENDLDWNLIDPHDKVVRETVSARKLWEEILTIRYRTGEPYLFFIDEANRKLPESQKRLGLRINGSNLCSEITLPTNHERTAVCCLSSLNAEKYDEWRDTSLVQDLVTMLDNVLEYFIEHAPPELAKAVYSASQERAIGIGVMGFHSYLQSKLVPFESIEAQKINKEMFAYIKVEAEKATFKLGAERGEAPDMVGTGRRNSNLISVAPNANSAILLGTSPSIEPSNANAYNHQTRAGSWLIKNHYLEQLLEQKGKNNEKIWQNIITSKGSVQHLDFLSSYEKSVFKTAIEIDQMWIIQHAADRQQYICQSQSVNLFFPSNTNKTYFNRVHLAAWKKGLKSLYYTRTMTPFTVQSVSDKFERVALKDGDQLQSSINIDVTDCISCQG